ncbi:MAG TPA: type III pantothenate kinase [Gammaproteobacteria bacterium]|nr:type III pantothenate kinase [Gammaproteobacteria bacterium]
MILLDRGNSSAKAQYRDEGGLLASFATRYRGDWYARLAGWLEDLPAKRCLLASVLDAARQQPLDACLAARFGDAVARCVAERERCGVVNAYEEPGRLGVDRWLALLGAASLVDGDCLIVDAGSAITLDLLRADGRHLGGAILPGINTSRERFRQIFSHIDFEDPRIADSAEPGSSTEAAIQIDYPLDSMQRLRDLVTDWLPRLEPEAAILLAGGDAARVQRDLRRPVRIVPDLVFLGLARLADE